MNTEPLQQTLSPQITSLSLNTPSSTTKHSDIDACDVESSISVKGLQEKGENLVLDILFNRIIMMNG